MKCINKTTGKIIADKLVMKDSFFGRLRGLLGVGRLSAGEGIILKPCAQIHTFFMSIPIDVIFVSGDFEVIYVIENMPTWRLSPLLLKSLYTVEVAAGALNGGVKKGDMLSFEDI
jgi:uncharacterized membrane protein (UPF0127 family)